MLHRTGDILKQIAARTPGYEGHKWRLPSNQTPLATIAGKEPTARLYEIEKKDSVQANILLRDLLIGPLRSKDMDQRRAAIKWILYSWGGIGGESDKEDQWPKELQKYEPKVIDEFIENHYTDRIASWSKVLAFADSSRYAIYDARVVMSLNAILDNIGYKNRFRMPQSRVENLNPIFSRIKKHVAEIYNGRRPTYMGYFDYMDLLHAMVEEGAGKSVLDLEMRLFANSESFANSYIEKHGLEIPYPNLKQPTP